MCIRDRIHRACFGSLERFIGILTEHFAGAFPTWMAPVQGKIMAISEHQAEYAKNIAKAMTTEYIRVEADVRNEKIGYKIRQAQMEKVPYMLVVGDKEMADGTVSIRKRGEGEIGAMDWKAFMADLQKEIKERR